MTEPEPLSEQTAGPASVVAPVVGQSPEPTTEGEPDEQPDVDRRDRRCRCWPWVLAALLAFGLLSWALDRDEQSQDHSAASGTSSRTPNPASPRTTATGFTLPPPTGSVPRTVPSRTVWITDSDLPAEVSAALRREAPAVLTYQRTFGLTQDRVGYAAGRRLRPVSTPGISPFASDPPVSPAAAVHLAARQLRAFAGKADRAVVITTDRPQEWLSVLPRSAYGASGASTGHPGTRYYLVVPDRSARAIPKVLPSSGPIIIRAAPARPGMLAKALARAWVDNVGALWTG